MENIVINLGSSKVLSITNPTIIGRKAESEDFIRRFNGTSLLYMDQSLNHGRPFESIYIKKRF